MPIDELPPFSTPEDNPDILGILTSIARGDQRIVLTSETGDRLLKFEPPLPDDPMVIIDEPNLRCGLLEVLAERGVDGDWPPGKINVAFYLDDLRKALAPQLPDRLRDFMFRPLKVLDDGHVQIVDVMGSDMTIVNAARVSYGAGTKRVSKDRHLIRYLMRHSHSTPFEMCSITFRVRVPMDHWRQWVRHRTASINEYSTRYSEAINSTQKTDEWRTQAKSNKQGSAGILADKWELDEHGNPKHLPSDYDLDYFKTPTQYLDCRERELHALARRVYEERLALGVAREQARKDLPLSTYTEAYWKMDLHNLFHFLRLRMDSHAQQEIREYANAIAEIVKVWVPWAWEAFEDYRLGGMYLTKFEVEGLRRVLKDAQADTISSAIEGSGLPKGRERSEFEAKLQRMLG